MTRALAILKTVLTVAVLGGFVAAGAYLTYGPEGEPEPAPPPIIVVGWDSHDQPYVKDVWGE
ncbi:hypothetical protein ACFCZ3_20095 [Cellulosimicrobium cellulans]|uniref:hypothetical protein n=1 Tax=Cellulosimicrobium cellulans TaxID=1710 RepID=UPI0035D88FBC